MQTLAVMEVLHAATGLVPSAVGTTIVQVASRLVVLWAVVAAVPAAQTSPFFALMASSWAAVEVPRYAYLGARVLGVELAPLKWARYSLFAVLYPSGITGEVGSIVAALPFFDASGALSVALPNAANFVYSHAFALRAVLALVYPPGSWLMYTHMLAQRRKNLAPAEKDAGKGAAAPSSRAKKTA